VTREGLTLEVVDRVIAGLPPSAGP